MANDVQILDKIERNMKQRGFEADVTRTSAGSLDVDGLTVSYAAKEGHPTGNPMQGVDDSTSPFLGVGVAGAGSIKIKGAGGENTIAAILDNEVRATLYAEAAGFANDLILEEGDSTTELARIGGHAHLPGLGE